MKKIGIILIAMGGGNLALTDYSDADILILALRGIFSIALLLAGGLVLKRNLAGYYLVSAMFIFLTIYMVFSPLIIMSFYPPKDPLEIVMVVLGQWAAAGLCGWALWSWWRKKKYEFNLPNKAREATQPVTPSAEQP